jgi:hypothetical protein
MDEPERARLDCDGRKSAKRGACFYFAVRGLARDKHYHIAQASIGFDKHVLKHGT